MNYKYATRERKQAVETQLWTLEFCLFYGSERNRN